VEWGGGGTAAGWVKKKIGVKKKGFSGKGTLHQEYTGGGNRRREGTI